MRLSWKTNSLLAGSSFILAAWCGWQRPGVGSQQQVMSTAAPAETVEATASSSASTLAATGQELLARVLEDALNQVSGKYSGKRLTELCLQPHPDNIPGASGAFSYAGRWARQDPVGMYRWFLERGSFTLPAGDASNYGFLNIVFTAWAKIDRAAAIEAVLTLRDTHERIDGLCCVIRQMRIDDPTAARALAQHQLAFLADHPDQAHSLLSAYGPAFKDTWSFLLELPAGIQRGKLLAEFLEDATRYHGHPACNLWTNASRELKQELVSGGFAGGTKASDEESDGGEGSDTPIAFNGLKETILAKLAADPTQVTLARSFYNREGAMWMETNPSEAVQWSLEHLRGKERVDLTAQLFSEVTPQNFSAVLTIWQTLPDGLLRAKALGRLVDAAPEDRLQDLRASVAKLNETDFHAAKEAMSENRSRLEKLK